MSEPASGEPVSGQPASGEPVSARASRHASAAEPGEDDLSPSRKSQQRFERILTLSRFLVLIPVVFLLLDAAASFIYGTDILFRTATDFSGEPRVGATLGRFLIVMDTFLVGATFMIVAFGFYELFIVKNGRVGQKYWLPSWLMMRDLEDLKARVVSMLILVAAITFVDVTVESHDEQGIFFMGLGIAVVIVALTAFLRWGRHTHAPVVAANNPPAAPTGPAPPTDLASGPGPASGVGRAESSRPASGQSMPPSDHAGD